MEVALPPTAPHSTRLQTSKMARGRGRRLCAAAKARQVRSQQACSSMREACAAREGTQRHPHVGITFSSKSKAGRTERSRESREISGTRGLAV